MTTDDEPRDGSDPTDPTDQTNAGDGGEGAADPAVESLQAAARQVIAATRGFLDAAEALVDDPAVLRDALGGLGSLAQEAARMAAQAGRRAASGATGGPAGGEDDGPDDEGPVQHIPVG